VGNGPAFAGDDEILLKAEGSAEPLDCGWRIAIAKTGYHRRSGVLPKTGHEILLSAYSSVSRAPLNPDSAVAIDKNARCNPSAANSMGSASEQTLITGASRGCRASYQVRARA